MDFTISKDTLVKHLTTQIEAYHGFQRNIDKYLVDLATSAEIPMDLSILENLNYNKRMQSMYLERAASALELVGLFSETDGDCLNLATITDKLTLLHDMSEL